MNHPAKVKLKLFTSTLLLSAFTFGGGYVIVPLMKKKFVDDLKWIEEKEVLNLVAIAQSSPGAIAVNASILLGHRIAGHAGALIAVAGTILPPLVLLSVISLFYPVFQESALVQAVLQGMQAGVTAVIADVTVNLGRNVLRENRLFSLLIMSGAFAAAFIGHVNVVWIILACGLVGALRAVLARRSAGEDGCR